LNGPNSDEPYLDETFDDQDEGESDEDSSDFVERPEFDGKVVSVSLRSATHQGAPCVEVSAHEDPFESGVVEAKTRVVLIARMDRHGLTMFPTIAASYLTSFLTPKYGKLTTIRIAMPSDDPLPRTIDEFDEVLGTLPVGFSRHARFGMGLKWEYRLIPEAVASIPGVTELVLDDSAAPRIDGASFHLGRSQFEELRRGLSSIILRARARSLEDRRALAFNELLHAADPAQFPKQIREPKPHEIYELVKVGAGERRSSEVQRAALTVIKEDAMSMAKESPLTLMTLAAKIEEVALAELIARMAKMLESDMTEAKWQAFFKANPFVLGIAFPYPMTLIQDQAHVGGATIRGDGESIADFLFGQRITGSLALIEIKRPSTPLVEAKAFRGDLYAPHRDLVAAVAQVLDQRAQLIENFAAKSRTSDLRDKHVASVHCVVVAGTAPKEPAHKRSLDLFRNASKDVAIVTFDELLDKLRHIHKFMSRGEARPSESSATEVAADPDETDSIPS
jgi:hypothetical protein